MERTYPGTCEGKNAARRKIYEYVKHVSRNGYGVILAGPEPEVELAVVAQSGWPFEQLVVVDCVASPALWSVPNLAPGARVVRADAADAISLLSEVSWFNGDFMGFSRNVLHAVTVCAERLLDNGFIALTWARGRGSGVFRKARDLGSTPVDGIDRMVMSASGLNMDYYTQYKRRGGMAMGVGVWVG